MLVLSSESEVKTRTVSDAGTHISGSGYEHYYLDINARCGTPVQDLVCGTAEQCGVQMQRRARVTIQLISRTMPMAN